MPVVEYQCHGCATVYTEYFKLQSWPYPEHIACKRCKNHRAHKIVSRPHSDMIEFHKPIEMLSIACNSFEEIREMQKAGIDCSDDPDSENFGVPVVKSRKEKLTALKVAKFVEAK